MLVFLKRFLPGELRGPNDFEGLLALCAAQSACD
jgi:hypothetical protein